MQEETQAGTDAELKDVRGRYAAAWRSKRDNLAQIIPLTSYLDMHTAQGAAEAPAPPPPALRCDLCDITATSVEHLKTHFNGNRHARRVALYNADAELKQRFTASDVLKFVEFSKWRCVPCNTEMSVTAVSTHIEGARHRNCLARWMVKNVSKIFCTACNLNVDESMFVAHSQSPEHLRAIALAAPALNSAPAENKQPPRGSSSNSHSSVASSGSKLNALAKEFKPASPPVLPAARNSPRNPMSRAADTNASNIPVGVAAPSPIALALKDKNSATESSTTTRNTAAPIAAPVPVQKNCSPANSGGSGSGGANSIHNDAQQSSQSQENTSQPAAQTREIAGADVVQPNAAALVPALLPADRAPPPSSTSPSGSVVQPETAAPITSAQSTVVVPNVMAMSLNQPNPLSVSSTFTFEILPSNSLQDPNKSRLRAGKLNEPAMVNDKNHSVAESPQHSAPPQNASADAQTDTMELNNLPRVPRIAPPPVPKPVQATPMAVDDAATTPSANSSQPNMAVEDAAMTPSANSSQPNVATTGTPTPSAGKDAIMMPPASQNPTATPPTNAVPPNTSTAVPTQAQLPPPYTAHSPVRKNAGNRVDGGGSSRSGSVASKGSQRSNRSQFYCITCSVQCNANGPFQEHLRSARHLRASGAQGSPPLKKKKWNSSSVSGSTVSAGVAVGGQFFCEICRVACSGASPFQEHLRSSRHLRKLEATTKQSPSQATTTTKSEPRSKVTVAATAGAATGATTTAVKKVKNEEKKCNLCDVVVCGEGNFMDHLKGKAHGRRLRTLTDAGETVPIELLPPQQQAVAVGNGSAQ